MNDFSMSRNKLKVVLYADRTTNHRKLDFVNNKCKHDLDTISDQSAMFYARAIRVLTVIINFYDKIDTEMANQKCLYSSLVSRHVCCYRFSILFWKTLLYYIPACNGFGRNLVEFKRPRLMIPWRIK